MLVWHFYTSKILEPENSPSSSETKKKTVIRLAKESKARVFIETGTYIGRMLEAVNRYFDVLYSIEIDKKLHLFCKKKFQNNKKIHLFCGDSARILSKILKKVKSPTFFWLDAHYSGGITSMAKTKTPIEAELKIILQKWQPGSRILIDDARLFNGSNGYPEIKDIEKLIKKLGLKITLKNDILLIK